MRQYNFCHRILTGHHAHAHMYSTKLIWLKTWQLKLQTRGTRAITCFQRHWCTVNVKCSKHHSTSSFFLAEAEQPAPKEPEDDNTAKSTVEMEGKIGFACIWFDLIGPDREPDSLIFRQYAFLFRCGGSVLLCIGLVWSALFLLSAACQTPFCAGSISAYLKSTVSWVEHHFVLKILGIAWSLRWLNTSLEAMMELLRTANGSRCYTKSNVKSCLYGGGLIVYSTVVPSLFDQVDWTALLISVTGEVCQFHSFMS